MVFIIVKSTNLS